jgi:membrane fusion protein, multidrug efflux system
MISIANDSSESADVSTRSATATGNQPRPLSGNTSAAKADSALTSEATAGPKDRAANSVSSQPVMATHAAHPYRKWVLLAVVVVGIGIGGHSLIPFVETAMNTVSTDDAYVNGDVTYVAPRVNGQVANVFVKDNNVVRKGELLLELDSEPYQVQVNVAQAAVDAAKADLIATRAKVNGLEAQVRSYQFNMRHAIEEVHDKTAELRASVAGLDTAKATLVRATADYQRALAVQKTPGAISQQDVDRYQETFRTTTAQVKQALEHVHQIRVSLGLPAAPASDSELADVPADLDQTFSAVREVQGKLMEAAAELGVSGSFDKLPYEMEKDFFSRYPNQDIDHIFAKLIEDAPDIKRAGTKLLQAERNLDQAKLNLRYCKVYAEIDGAVTSKNVNPGNNVRAGQSVMTLRSLNDLWIDANFKETQLSKLRIGQPVKIETDMYGSRQEFNGRISGFTMGTGQTLSLLPPQNATGNYVKIVQRLPVRIDLTDYDSRKVPLFVGLSVTPYVYFKEPATGTNAGEVLQPLMASR